MYGFADFTDGQTLLASDVDGVLRQTLMTFASEAARDSALSGVLENGMIAQTLDTGTIWNRRSGAWVAWWSPWTAYTPTWGNLTVGNGSVVAAYAYRSGDLRFRGQLTFGSTTAVSGIISTKVPLSRAADSYPSGGGGTCIDASASSSKTTTIQISPSATDVFFVAEGGLASPTIPFTWTTSDVLVWDITVGVA